MSHLSRRQLLAGFLGGLAQAAGTVVLARAVLPETAAQGNEASTSAPSRAGVQERADQLVARQEPPDEEGSESFVTTAFRRGGFARGGYGGGYAGGFRRGGYAGGYGGGFRRGGFGNGGGYGGGFRKGGFANGGYGGGFRNGGFRNW
jgi:rSAM-associated Gly-rich repeat protein